MEEIGYAESGGFELNTLDGSSVSGLGFSDSGGFELDTRDSNSEGVNTDLTGFGDTPGFSLDTTDGNGTDSNATGDQLVTVSGTVFYDGVVPGAAYVWALEANGSTAAEQILPAGEGNYTLTVAQGKAYDFKAFIDGTGNGYPNNGEVWKHFLDWNQTLGGFNLTQVDGNLSGIDFHLSDKDADFDGFLDWHEYQAGTGINEHNSTPGLDFGLVAHWNFDETNGTVLADLSGNELNGTLQGFNGGWEPGRIGGSLRFDGVDDYVSFPNLSELDDLRPFSFSGWLKLDDNGSGYVLAKRSGLTGYWRLHYSPSTINWLVRQTNDIEPTIRTDLTRPYQTWQHLAVSWSGKLSGINTRIYLDGQETLSVTRSVGSGEILSDADNLFTLGNRPQNNTSYFKGWMDDFRIWNRTITADEVQSLFDSAPASSTGPIALTDANFQDAINLWFSAEANATALYGHISEWNVSAVTDMSFAFLNLMKIFRSPSVIITGFNGML